MISTGTEWLFSGQVTLGLAIVGAIACVLASRAEVGLSLLVMLPMVATEALMKDVLKRQNPAGVLEVRKLGPSSVLGPQFLQYSFPSGHASRAGFLILWLALLLAIRWRRPRVMIAALLITAAVCWSRIYAGDHWLIDIFGGLLLAWAFVSLSVLARLLLQRPPFCRLLRALGLKSGRPVSALRP